MLRSAILYMGLMAFANAGAAGTVDWQAARDAGLPKLAELAEPAPAPDVAITDPDGAEHRLADWKGKVLLVNFWATWCAPCREEMPSLDALQAKQGGDDFAVLTVAAGRNPPPAIDRFFAEEEIQNLPKLLDPRQELARAFGVLGLPVTVLIDREGREVARLIGDADWNSPAAHAVIEQLVAP